MSGFQKLLGPSQLTKLKEHKYSCVNYSLLDPYMNPFWIWLVDRCPQFIHPNSLTVSGLAVNAVTTLLLVWYSPDALTPVSGIFTMGIYTERFLICTRLRLFLCAHRLQYGPTSFVRSGYSFIRRWTPWMANTRGKLERVPS